MPAAVDGFSKVFDADIKQRHPGAPRIHYAKISYRADGQKPLVDPEAEMIVENDGPVNRR